MDQILIHTHRNRMYIYIYTYTNCRAREKKERDLRLYSECERKKVDEGIFRFSKAIVGDSCPGGPVCHVRVTCCTILSILTRFWP